MNTKRKKIAATILVLYIVGATGIDLYVKWQPRPQAKRHGEPVVQIYTDHGIVTEPKR